MIGISTLLHTRRACATSSVCVNNPRSGSPIAVAATEYPEMNAIGKPARAASLAESVSYTPGKTIDLCWSRMVWTRVLAMAAISCGCRSRAAHKRYQLNVRFGSPALLASIEHHFAAGCKDLARQLHFTGKLLIWPRLD